MRLFCSAGCTSGFGYLAALALDKEGFRVFAGCRSPNSQQANQLKSAASSRLTVVPVDVISDDSVKKVADYILSNLGQDGKIALFPTYSIRAFIN